MLKKLLYIDHLCVAMQRPNFKYNITDVSKIVGLLTYFLEVCNSKTN